MLISISSPWSVGGAPAAEAAAAGRDEATLARSFGFSSYRDPDPETLKLVDRHAETVIAVLSGHLHLTGMRMRGTVCHFALSGTASAPSDGAAVVDHEIVDEELDVGHLPAAFIVDGMKHASFLLTFGGRGQHERFAPPPTFRERGERFEVVYGGKDAEAEGSAGR